jgi:hypothetical protein
LLDNRKVAYFVISHPKKSSNNEACIARVIFTWSLSKTGDFIRIAYPSSLLNNQCARISGIQTNN